MHLIGAKGMCVCSLGPIEMNITGIPSYKLPIFLLKSNLKKVPHVYVVID
jgi:hypothetical protein